MSIDPSDLFRKIGAAQQEVTEHKRRAEYHLTKFWLRVAEFGNECKNEKAMPDELEVLREKAHDILDLYFDEEASQRMVAQKLTGEIKQAQGDK